MSRTCVSRASGGERNEWKSYTEPLKCTCRLMGNPIITSEWFSGSRLAFLKFNFAIVELETPDKMLNKKCF